MKIKRRKGLGGRTVLAVNVEEQQTGKLPSPQAYSTSAGIIGDVTYTERNLMGTGQFLQVQLSRKRLGAESLRR